MSEFEFYSHELLASLVQDGNPEVLSDRGYALRDAAETLGMIGVEISNRMKRVAWEGEAAEAFRAWGQHFGEESSVLHDYAVTIGDAMLTAGTALREAQTTMPPPPDSVSSPESRANPVAEMQAESDHQEAIRVVERLASFYRVSTDLMGNAEEPRFARLDGVLPPDIRGGGESAGINEPLRSDDAAAASVPGGVARPGSSQAAVVAPPGGSVEGSPGWSAADGVLRPGGGQGVVVPPGPAEGDGWVGTSLDSVDVVRPGPAPANPNVGPSFDSPMTNVPVSPGDSATPHGVPPSGVRHGRPPLPDGGTLPSRGTAPPSGGPGTRPPVVGRPPLPGGGSAHPHGVPSQSGGQGGRPPMVGRPPAMGAGSGQMTPRSRIGGERSQTPTTGRPPITGGNPRPSTPRTPMVGRPPAITGIPINESRTPAPGRQSTPGVPGTDGARSGAQRGWPQQERNGIVGGIPRQVESSDAQSTRIPQGGVIHPGRSAAERTDPGRNVSGSGADRHGGPVVTGRSDTAVGEGTYGHATADGRGQRADRPRTGLPRPQGVIGSRPDQEHGSRSDASNARDGIDGQRPEGETRSS
jgi:uncharacterized protein YukE